MDDLKPMVDRRVTHSTTFLVAGAACLFLVGLVLGLTGPGAVGRLPSEPGYSDALSDAPSLGGVDSPGSDPDHPAPAPEHNNEIDVASAVTSGHQAAGSAEAPRKPGAVDGAESARPDEEVPPSVRFELELGRDRWKEIKMSFPLPIDRKGFIARGNLENGAYMTILGAPRSLKSPPSRILDKEEAAGKKLPAHRFAELNDVLWRIEEKKAHEYRVLCERQNSVLAASRKVSTPLPKVVFWVACDEGLLVIRQGQDAEHDRISRRIDALRTESVELVEEYLREFGEAVAK